MTHAFYDLPVLSSKDIVTATGLTYGLKYNEYSGDFDSVITMEDLFR